MTQRNIHGYLGMIIDVSVKGKVMITIIDYIIKMLDILSDKMKEDIRGEEE